jgi:nitrate/TMAO reductase-like tetraheme cytochrome c subunit
MGRVREFLRFRKGGKWLLVGGVGFALLGTVSVEVTSTASFCNSCHIMEPYYASWKKGSHKDVQCIKCHIEPGAEGFIAAKLNGLGQVVDDVLNRTSNKPSASVSVLSCTRSGCHSVETLQKKEINNGKFKFRHDKHLGQKHLGVEISCGTCHAHVKGDQHFEVTTNVCITCHLVDSGGNPTEQLAGKESQVILMSVRPAEEAHQNADGEKVPPSTCTTCHEPPQKEVEFHGQKFDHAQALSFGATCVSCHQGVTATPPPIDDGRCLECHTFGVEKALDTKEMHRVHTLGDHKIECSSCHGSIRHGASVQLTAMEKFDCVKCHSDEHAVQRSNYLKGSPEGAAADDTSNPMFLAHVDCTGCHTQPRAVDSRPGSGSTVMAASPQSCDKCHQKGYGEKMVPLWQDTTKKLFNQVETDYAAAQSAAGDPEKLERAQKILDRVKADGSWGVHNPKNTQQLLERARFLVAEAKRTKEAPK